MQGAKVIKDLRHLADRGDEAEVRQALFRFGEDNFAVGMVSTVYREVAIYSFDQRLHVLLRLRGDTGAVHEDNLPGACLFF